MEKLKFKNFKANVSYNRPDNDSRINFYDENNELLDCFYADTEEEERTIIENLQNTKSEIELFSEFCDSFDYGTNFKDLFDNYVDTKGYIYEDKDIIEEIKKDIKTLSEKEIIYKYDINKIGKYYFIGEW